MLDVGPRKRKTTQAWLILRRSAWPYLHGGNWSHKTRSLIDGSNAALNDWSCMPRYLGMMRPVSSIVFYSTTPSGAISAPFSFSFSMASCFFHRLPNQRMHVRLRKNDNLWLERGGANHVDLTLKMDSWDRRHRLKEICASTTTGGGTHIVNPGLKSGWNSEPGDIGVSHSDAARL